MYRQRREAGVLKRLLLLCGIGITVALLWFSVNDYRASVPIAEENLRGLALSLNSAVESLVSRDPSFHSLEKLRPKDLAFLAVVDGSGVYRFHSNPDLIGTHAEDPGILQVLRTKEAREARITLGTGEKAYSFLAPLNLQRETLVVALTLHTYRADAVIRKAKLSMAILLSLILAGWILSAVIYRYARREEAHQLAMSRQENLARLGEMGAMLAHEIRNPLAGIKGYAQVIEKKPQEARNAGFARSIVAEALRLETLVSDLLAYAGDGALRREPVDLGPLIAWAVSFILCEAEAQKVSVEHACPEGVRFYGDRDRIGQVLLNLLKNALQAMPEGGRLMVTGDRSGGEVTLTVSDSGPGIAATDLDRIFEPFFTTKARGTGLGLPLCRKIVEGHGGAIRISSAPGQGTTVCLTLPGSHEQQARGVEQP